MQKKITIEVGEVDKIIGSPTYGQSPIQFKSEGFTNLEVIQALSGALSVEIGKTVQDVVRLQNIVAETAKNGTR